MLGMKNTCWHAFDYMLLAGKSKGLNNKQNGQKDETMPSASSWQVITIQN